MAEERGGSDRMSIAEIQTALRAAREKIEVEDHVALVDRLAALEHEQWMAWSKHIVEVEAISPKTYKRWIGLWVPYDQLSEEMKERDRAWARKALQICEDIEEKYKC